MKNRSSTAGSGSPIGFETASFTARNEVFAAVIVILTERFEVSARDVHLGSGLFEELGLDPLDQPDLALALEEAFDVDISPEEASTMLRVHDVVDCIVRRWVSE